KGCHCGDEPLTESADNCDTPCSGNSAVACGGDGSLSVFMFDAPVTPAPALGIDEADGATFLGCFEDNGRHRVLDARMKSNENHMDAEVSTIYSVD
ncbi:unnamed protein product, partial [Sphacelaria rigidula]